MILARDQYGTELMLRGEHPRKELCEELGIKSVRRIYQDKKDGRTVHVGYIGRGSWWTLYTVEPWEQEA